MRLSVFPSSERRRTSPWTLGAVLLSAALADPAAAAVYHVAPVGNDGNAGTQAAPFRQIRRALQVVRAGDTVLVADGAYLGFDVRGLNGAAAAPIVIQAGGPNVNVLPTTDRPDNRDTIFVTYSSHIVLDGLHSFNANRAAVRVDQSPQVTVRNGVYGNNAVWGIFTDFSDDLLLENNDCYGSRAEHGIYVSNSGDRPRVRGNRLHDNARCGLHMNGDVWAGGDGIISGALVENNVVFNNGVGGGSGINMDGVQDSTVRNNLVYGNHATGISAYRDQGGQGPRNLRILNNTVDQAADGRWAVHISETTGPITLRNNILKNRHLWRGSLEFTTSQDAANTDSDYNVMDWVTTDWGSTRISLAQWQSRGRDLHSFSAPIDGLWANPALGDYTLPTASPALDRGAALTTAPLDVLVDRAGLPRPQGGAWDLGCYELAAAGIDTTAPGVPGGLSATAGDASVQLRWSANPDADLAGYHVYRSDLQNGAYTRQNAQTLAAPAFSQNALANGTTWWYRVTAVDASGNESTPSAAVSVTPAANVSLSLASLTLSPSSVRAGKTARGTVTLSGPAPAGGVVVTLSSSAPAAAGTPGSVTILPGATAATFTITTDRTARGNVVISASYGGVTRSATLTITK